MSLPVPPMGGKRVLRHGVSPQEGQDAMSGPRPRDATATNPMTPFCPISIQIEECSDKEEEDEEEEEDGRTPDEGVGPWRERAARSPASRAHLKPRPPRTRAARPGTAGTSHPAARDSSGCLPSFLEVPDQSELSALKATAVRLNLRTRTSSFLEWQSQWLDNARAPPQFPLPVGEGGGEAPMDAERMTEERRGRINDALAWLKTELREMRSMDHHLARQLLSLRHDIHQLRLRRSCQEHRDLLDDVQSELEEQGEMSDVLDLPNDLTLNDTPLKQIGVTRMNISTRRFSMC